MLLYADCTDSKYKIIFNEIFNTIFNHIKFTFSCDSKKNSIKGDLGNLQSKEIVVSLNKMQYHINEKDIIFPDFNYSKMKLVIYSDSSAYSSCAIKSIYLWEEFIEYAEKYYG